MKRFILSLILVVSASSILLLSQSTTKTYEFKRISQEEIDLTTYKPDPSAEAVILFDKGQSYFIKEENGFEVIYERVTRIKILSEAGLKWANVEIPYYQEGNIYEMVEDIEAYTYNLVDGVLQNTALNSDNIYKEKINDLWNSLKFVMPNVKPGSIIEFKYKISSEYISQLRDWEFENRIPTIYSEYITKMIPFYSYSWILQGASKFTSYSAYEDKEAKRTFRGLNYNEMVYIFTMEDIPAFRDESFISSYNDYVMKLDLQLEKITNTSGVETNIRTTWSEMIKALDEHFDFGKYLNKSESYNKKSELLSQYEELPLDDRIKAVVNLIKHQYSWNGWYGFYATKSVKEFVDTKVGNTANINLFLAGALNSVGIEAYPVILSTRSHGKIKSDYPFTHFFNYVAVLVTGQDKTFLVDATDQTVAYNRLPPNCVNDIGLIIHKKREEWVETSYNEMSQEITQININLNESMDSLNTTISVTASEYEGISYRKRYIEGSKKLEDLLIGNSSRLNLIEINSDNINNPEEPLKLTAKVNYESESVNGKLYISPFLSRVLSENPLKQDKRDLPLDFRYPVARTYYSSVKIPEGYEKDYLPKAMSYTNDLVELSLSIEEEEDSINILFTYMFKKSTYPAQNYRELKSFYNDILTIGAERVVLKEISTSPSTPQLPSQVVGHDY
jgi:hypothetical protein